MNVAAHSPVPSTLYGRKCAVAHPRAAGDERGERADEADEAPDQDRLPAVAREVGLDLGEALGRDPHLGPVAEDEVAPEPARRA